MEAAMAAHTLGCGSSSAAGAAMVAHPDVRSLGTAESPINAGVGHVNGGLLQDAVDNVVGSLA